MIPNTCGRLFCFGDLDFGQFISGNTKIENPIFVEVGQACSSDQIYGNLWHISTKFMTNFDQIYGNLWQITTKFMVIYDKFDQIYGN